VRASNFLSSVLCCLRVCHTLVRQHARSLAGAGVGAQQHLAASLRVVSDRELGVLGVLVGGGDDDEV
jgi:hypothetical protein